MTTRSPETSWAVAADRACQTNRCGRTRDQKPAVVDSGTEPQPDDGVISVHERIRLLPRRVCTHRRVPPEVFLG